MDLNQKNIKVKLAPINSINGVLQEQPKINYHLKDRNRLKRGCTSLMYACQQGLGDTIVNEIRSQKRDKSNKNTLHYCTGQKSLLPAAVIIMTAPHLMEQADEDGFKPIHLAVIQGTLETVNLLLANKVNVNALDNEGHSVAHWATVCGEAQILRTLLSAGADASIPDMNGATPLHYAAQMCGYDGKSDKTSTKLALEILGILLKHPKCTVEVEDKDGRQPLMWAASAGSEEAILALIKAGAYAENSDKDGLTALHCAASRGHTKCIELLIKLCGAQVDTIDSNGCTALFYAVTLGHADATVKLLDLGADPNRQDRKGRSPGHCGCSKGQFETVKILNSRGANLWLRNARGDLPVHEAATSGRMELVEWLLQQKQNHINSSSNDGRTILHIAAGNDKIDMCKMLIETGADVNAVYRNAKNVVKTPLDCALQKGFRTTAKYIQMHGGLPANKLRLSGRKTHNILPELDDVKPLKFTEIEVTYEQKERRSSKASESDTESEALRSRDRHKKHRKCSHKRRTSSCSEMFICHRADEPCEINRSKSSNELHRRRKSSSKRHSISSSSESDTSQSDSEDEECCYHIKRKHRCYKKVRNKSKEREYDSGKENYKEQQKKNNRRSSDSKKGSESSDKDQARIKRDKKKVEIASSAKKSDNNKTVKGGGKNVNDSKVATKAQLSSATTNKNLKRPPSAKPAMMQKKGSQDERSKSIDKPKTPDIPDEPSIDNSKKSTTTTEEVSEDDKGIKEITTQADIHETMQTDVDEGALTDATYTIEKRDKSDIAAAFEPETIKEEVSIQESNKKVSFKGETVVEGSAVVDENKEKLQQHQQHQQEDEIEKIKSKISEAPVDYEQQLQYTDDNMEESFSPSSPEKDEYDPQLDELPENIQRPKSQTPESIGSFTVLDDGDDAEQKLKEFEEMTQDDTYQNLDDEFYDDSSSMEKLPKRSKVRHTTDGGGFKVLDDSKDQDSGIEPSPRSHRTKIPAPRSIYSSAVPISRRSIIVAEDRPRSTRIEGRKPGDKNACNMTTVTQSIQKNIRRYYMERKIFQHLLELKSLQIRSCKSNEAVLVKRAVDDYHKSVADLGFEVGGVLSKYQLREYTFKNFELFLYETLKSLQKPGTFNFQNIAEVYREAERRLSPDFSRCEKALYCTTKTHRCLHAAHAYTGIPCAAYIPLMNHHTMPKIGFGPYKSGPGTVGTFYLPKILTNSQGCQSKVSLEFSNTNNKKYSTTVPLPSEKLDSNKRYLVTFTVNDNENQQKELSQNNDNDDEEQSK